MMRSQRVKKMFLLVCLLLIPTFSVLMHPGSAGAQVCEILPFKGAILLKGQRASKTISFSSPCAIQYYEVYSESNGSMSVSLSGFGVNNSDESPQGYWYAGILAYDGGKIDSTVGVLPWQGYNPQVNIPRGPTWALGQAVFWVRTPDITPTQTFRFTMQMSGSP